MRRLGDGERGRRMPISVGGGQEPRWSRDGRELFYRSSDSLFVVPLEIAGPDIRPGTPRALFADPYVRGFNAYYDVHPNGQEFLFIRARFDIRVELNALDELRGRR